MGGFLAQRVGQPLMVGYILAGVAVGPFTGGPTVENIHDIEQMAELGVALLLFSLGLELSFRELAPVKWVALAGAIIQIVLTIALGVAIGRWLGWSLQAAFWFGSLVALSSTMVTLKTIQAQGRLGTLSSRVMLGLLIVQDLAVVPLMIVLPEASFDGMNARGVLLATVRAVVLLGAIVLFSTKVVPQLLAFVARRNSRELFFLTVMTLAIGVGYGASYFGLSMAIGAFVAGLVVNESEYAHQALSDVAPLRDLFGMMFFVSVGMLVDVGYLVEQPGTVAGVALAVFIGKALILAVVVRAFGYKNVIPLAAGLTLFQVGEFAFVLAREGRSIGAISNDVYALMLNVAIITMMLTPVMSGTVPWLYGRFWPQRDRERYETANLPESGLADHVVIAGGGRVGRTVATALKRRGLPTVLIESDDRHARTAREEGLPVIYGDATQPVVLEAADLEHARAILITVPAFPDVRSIVMAVRRVRPDLTIMARADSAGAVRALRAYGIHDVTSPEFEAAIEMTRQALTYFDVEPQDVMRLATDIRRERYES